jgi:hypothetical protein
MNGRIYDPLLGRFLSADVVVQAPGNLQAYNRYSYVKNNPLTLTDPSGFEWIDDFKKDWSMIVNALLSDPAKSEVSHEQVTTSAEDKLINAHVAQGVEKGLKTLEAAAGATNALVKSTPILGQIVTAGNALTGKNILDPTGSTKVNRAGEGGELAAGIVVGAAAEKLAPVISRVGGKIATAFKGEVDSLVAPAVKAAETAVPAGQKLLGYTGKLADHHVMPRQFEKFFKSRGIGIDDFTVSVDHNVTHLKAIHGTGNMGQMPGRWNQIWGDWIKANPNATSKEIFQQAGQMMDDFGIGHLKIHPYGKP